MNRLERILILLPWLQAHQGSTTSEVAQHFGVSEEQIVQDVLLLSITGSGQFYGEQFSVDIEDDRIYVGDALGLDRPVKFDTAEAATLLLGLEAISTLPKVDRNAVRSAIAKLESVLPLMSHLHVDVGANRLEIGVLHKALARGTKVCFHYWNSGRDDYTQREVSPWRVYFKDGVNFLDAYCHSSGGWRTFRLDRIDALEDTDSSAELPSIEFEPMNLEEVEISVSIADESLLEDFTVVKRVSENGAITATLKVFGTAFLLRRVLASGGRIVITDPTLRLMAQKAAQNALNAYGVK